MRLILRRTHPQASDSLVEAGVIDGMGNVVEGELNTVVVVVVVVVVLEVVEGMFVVESAIKSGEKLKAVH